MLQHLRMKNAGNGIAGPMLHYASGALLFGEGDEAEDVLKVVSGVVRTCRFLRDGRRVIDAFHACGDVFGFEGGTMYSLSAEAVCACTVIAYGRKPLAELASTDGNVSEQVLSYALLSLARSQRHALLLARRSAQAKMAAFLIERAEASNDHATVDLDMTRQDIADYLALTVETVSRTLSQFQRTLLIELPTSRKIRIRDSSSLRRLDS